MKVNSVSSFIRSSADRKALTTADMPSGHVQSHTASMCEFPIMWNRYCAAFGGHGSGEVEFDDCAAAPAASKPVAESIKDIEILRTPCAFITFPSPRNLKVWQPESRS
jgi:hypothetical protein